MNDVFYSSVDFILKRSCQFILKRTTIASYIDLDDSLLDSLQVNTRDRKASIHNIRLKHDVINNNEFLHSKMIHVESVNISEVDLHLQSLCSGMNYKLSLIGDGLVKCVINGLDIVVVVKKKNTELLPGTHDDFDVEERVTTVTSEHASIHTVLDASNKIHDDNTDDDDGGDEHIQHINYIKDWIKALQYRFAITFSIRCVSIKIITRTPSSSSSPKPREEVIGGYLHENDSIIQLVLLIIIILSLWLPIFYYHYYLYY